MVDIENDLIEKIRLQEINISKEFIIDRLQDRFRWPLEYPYMQGPSIEFIEKNGTKFDSQDLFPDMFLNPYKALHLFHLGYTIIISNVGTLHRDIRKLYYMLTEHYQRHIQINMYAGTGESSISFYPHNHDYDVIVKNVCGKSKWIIGNEEKDLKDNEILVIPMFTDHSVISIENFKLTLTCNIM